MSLLHVVVSTVLFLSGGGPAAEAFVTVEQGDLPIILSAPHGGSLAVPGVEPRTGEGVKQFVRGQDARTATLTEQLADEIEAKFGRRPYVVIARFHRKYIDANRRASQAYESEVAKPTYDAYHAALAKARSDVMQRWGRGLLLDIHGQRAEREAIIRGTQNGQTTTHLVGRFGRESLIGKMSLFGRLADEGFPVIPAVGSDATEHDRYDGGYIVWTYGSRTGGTVDAIQLECGRAVRESPETAAKIASALHAYAADYLPAEERSPRTDVIRVGVYRDAGAGASVKNVLSVLRASDEFTVREVTAVDIRSGVLAELDVLIQPGGSGGKQGRHLGEDGRESIRTFVRDGGGFIGVCAGAYLASADYEWSLHLLDAKVLDRKHWARGTGTVRIGLSDAGRETLEVDDETVQIYYGQGPLLAPADRDDIPDYEPLATYETEIAKKGAPSGVMIGTTAIAAGRFGRGHVVCFSPHPEKTDGLGRMLREAVERVGDRSADAE